jgi:hypothetical protein
MEDYNNINILDYCRLCPIYEHTLPLHALPAGTQVSTFIRGDGNCGFRAIAYYVWGDQEGHEQVRRDACQIIASNYPSFRYIPGGLMSSINRQNQEINDYLTYKWEVAAGATDVDRYCDQALIQAAAIHYGRRINVYDLADNGSAYLSEFVPTNAQEGHLPFSIVHYRNHFEVLELVPGHLDNNLNEQEQQVWLK